jgi:hypothetical protein
VENNELVKSFEVEFQTLDRYASASYLMHIFALGLINEKQLYYLGGYKTFQEYCESKFDYKKSQIASVLSVFCRLSPFILESYRQSSGAPEKELLSETFNPEELQKTIVDSSLNKLPMRKLDVIIKLSDAKLRNLINKGKVTMGKDQTFTIDEIAGMDRDRLRILVSGRTPVEPKTEADFTEEEKEFARGIALQSEDFNHIREGFAYQAMCHAYAFEDKLQDLNEDIYNSYLEHVQPVMKNWLNNVIKARQMFPSDFNVTKK